MRGYVRVLLMLAVDGWTLGTQRPNWVGLAACLRTPARAQANLGTDRYVAVLAGATLWLVGCWLALGLACTLVGTLPGRGGSLARSLAQVILPRAIRTVLVAVTTTSVTLSAATGTATAAPQHGTPAAPSQPSATSPAWPVVAAHETAPLQPTGQPTAQPTPNEQAEPPLPRHDSAASRSDAVVPRWPTSASATASAARSASRNEQTVVRTGDSLWRIAADQLGPTATDQEIAALWPRWFEANRRVIGPDPKLILPGTKLVDPEGPSR